MRSFGVVGGASMLEPIEKRPPMNFDLGKATQDLKGVLEQGLITDLDRPANLDEYMQTSPFAIKAQEYADKALLDIDGIMGDIRDLANDSAFDTSGLVGLLNETFETTKNKMLDSVLASTQKSSYEMDAYLGSSGSDTRSIVRRNMANSVAGNLVANTQRNIAELFSGHIDKVVETTLSGAKINADVKINAARAMADLAGKGADIILGTNTALLQSYSQSVNVGIELIKAKSALLTNIYGQETDRLNSEISMEQLRGKMLTDPVYAKQTALTAFDPSWLRGTIATTGMRMAYEDKATALINAGYGSF